MSLVQALKDLQTALDNAVTESKNVVTGGRSAKGVSKKERSLELRTAAGNLRKLTKKHAIDITYTVGGKKGSKVTTRVYGTPSIRQAIGALMDATADCVDGK